MGLFNFTKKQLLSVIEWEDSSKDVMVYKFPLNKREEIMNSSTLVVRPSQVALFVHKGQICDVFAPGTYKLATENIPFLTKILSLPTGFDSPIKAEVYFVNTKQMTGHKWGTQNPIMMRDADFGNVRLRAFGMYSFKVKEPKTFMEQVFGTNNLYKTSDVSEQLRSMIVQGFSDAVAESKISALDLASSYKEFAKEIIEKSEEEFGRYGLKLCSLVIENISLPEEVEKALDERTKLGIIEDKVGTYAQYQTVQAIRDAANNPSGNNLAGAGVGIGAGVGMGQILTETLKNIENKPRKTEIKNEEATKTCAKCGAVLKSSAKFCSECGEKQPEAKKTKFCTKCGASVKSSAKFCPDCGEKF